MRVRRLRPLLTLAGIAAAAHAEERPSQIRFAEQAFGGWKSWAVTQVDYERAAVGDSSYPYVRDVQCWIQRNGMTVTSSRAGTIAINLSGEDPAGDASNRSFGTGNVWSLRVGKNRYEAKGVDTLHFRRKFSDVPYRSVPDEDVILPIFGGHVAVRRAPDQPWLNIASLLPEMLRARSLEIGHGRVVDGRIPNLYYLTVPLAGLREALVWCEQQIGSEAAYRFGAR